MRVLVALAVLMAGVWAAVANLAPSRFVTEMSPLTSDEGRIASFSPDKTKAIETVSEFKTTAQAAEVNDVPANTRVAEPDSWAQGTTSSIASNIDAETRTSLARDIQAELARLGCYAGPVNGDWSADTQRAASLFATEANARIPVDQPDFALFSMAKAATGEQACGPAVTVAQVPIAPAMGLGGPGAEKRERPVSYRRDRDVEQLFTNPLGR